MLSVGVNGYGTIGKRVADAIAAQPDMALAGVTKTKPDAVAAVARERGYRLFAPDAEAVKRFRTSGFRPAGRTEDLVARSDVMVDATPGGVGESYLPVYREYDTPAVFQGKESAELVDTSFVARANYDAAAEARYVRVVSCNTTALVRCLTPLTERYPVDRVRVTLVRRGGDPAQSDRGPINDVIPDPPTIPSHHGPDVQTVLPQLDITTTALRVPTTLMHVHAINLDLADTPDVEEVADLFERERRIFVIPETLDIDGIAAMAEYGRDRGRPRADVWESCLWRTSLAAEDDELYFMQAVHQESNVVPENIDAIRAIAGVADRDASMRRTDEVLGVGDWTLPSPPRTAPLVSGE